MCSNKISIKVIDNTKVINNENAVKETDKTENSVKNTEPEIFDFWKLFYGIKD